MLQFRPKHLFNSDLKHDQKDLNRHQRRLNFRFHSRQFQNIAAIQSASSPSSNNRYEVALVDDGLFIRRSVSSILNLFILFSSVFIERSQGRVTNLLHRVFEVLLQINR